MINKIKNIIIDKNLIANLLIIFIAIQPLIDLYFLFDEKYMFLGFAWPTIIRIFGIFILGIMFIFTIKKKEMILYVLYGILIITYAIFHHLNALNFTDYYNGYDFGYNLISEAFYIIRMLIPLGIIAISSHQKITDKKLNNLVFILIILICGSIIITNIFKVSTGSYSKEIIKGNIICWFKSDRCNLTYYDLASKGLFKDANRISALLALLTPIGYYCFLKKPNLKNKIMILINMLGMFILGTKVSTYGFIMLTIISLLVYIYFSFIKKEYQFNKKTLFYLCIILGLCIIILPKAPALNRTNIDNKLTSDFNANIDGRYEQEKKEIEEINNIIKLKYIETNHLSDEEINKLNALEVLEKLTKEEQNKILEQFIKNNYLDYHISTDFILYSYPYTYDTAFWYRIMTEPINNRINYRYLEQSILMRVTEKNNNSNDKLLGISFTRMSNIFDLEKDFVSHYYTLGLVGLILLLMPYIIITAICGIKILMNYQKHFTSKNIFYIIGIGITLFAAYFSGNVMDGLIVTIILGFVIGQLINNIYDIN